MPVVNTDEAAGDERWRTGSRERSVRPGICHGIM